MISLYRKYLFQLAVVPLTWLSGVFFVFVSWFVFYVNGGNLNSFFSVISYSMLVIIPAFVSFLPFQKKNFSEAVTDVELVLSRELAVCTFIVSFLLLTLFFSIFSVDISLWTGYGGLILLVFSVCALSCMIACFFEKTAVAFFFSMFVLSLFFWGNSIAKNSNCPVAVALVFKAISFPLHIESSSKGIVDIRDLIFFISTFLFCTLSTAFVILSKRGQPAKMLKKPFCLALLAFFLINIDSSRYLVKFDLTTEKRFSVGEYSRTLLAEVDSPLTITYYRSNRLKNLYPQIRDVEDYLASFASAEKNVKYELVSPENENFVKKIEAYGLQGQEIKNTNGTKTEYEKVFSGIAINYLGQTEVIPFVLSLESLEYDLSSRIDYLVRKRKKTVQVLIGNGMLLDEEYSYIVPYLNSQGFSVVESFLPSSQRDSGDIFSLRQDIPLVVIGTSSFTREDSEALYSFVNNGGKAFIATTPYTVDLVNGWTVQDNSSFDNAVQVLQRLGLFFADSLTASLSNFELTLQNSTAANSIDIEHVEYPLWPMLPRQNYLKKGMTSFWPCSVSFDNEIVAEHGLRAKEILKTPTDSWQVKKDGGGFDTNPFTIKKFSTESCELGSFLLCVALYKDDHPSFFVMGDQYAFCSTMIAFSSGENGVLDLRSLEFLSDSLLILNGQDALVKLKRGNPKSIHSRNNVHEFVCLLLPLGIIVFLFILFNLRRKAFNEK